MSKLALKGVDEGSAAQDEEFKGKEAEKRQKMKKSLNLAISRLNTIVESHRPLCIVEVINRQEYNKSEEVKVVTDQHDILIRYIKIIGKLPENVPDAPNNAYELKTWDNDSEEKLLNYDPDRLRELYENYIPQIIDIVKEERITLTRTIATGQAAEEKLENLLKA